MKNDNTKNYSNYNNSELVNRKLLDSVERLGITSGELTFENKYKRSSIIHKSSNAKLPNGGIESFSTRGELIEELLIDLSLLLAKLRDSLNECELMSKKHYNRNTILDLIGVCISVGLKITDIIEEKCTKLENECDIINGCSISCNWFTYWNETLRRNSLFNDIREFELIKRKHELLIDNNDDNKFSEHICTVNCVKYGKSISDFKMLCKVANNLFHKAFIMNIWFSRDYSNEFDQVNIGNNASNYFINYDNARNKNGLFNENKQSNSIESDSADYKSNCWKDKQNNDLVRSNTKVGFCDNEVNDNNNNNNSYNHGSLFEAKSKSEYLCESSDGSKMNSFEDIFLPEILCTTMDEIELNDAQNKDTDIKFEKEASICIRNNSRRTSIIIENIDYESLAEFNSNIKKLQKSILKVKEVQNEVNRLIVESNGDIDHLEEQTSLTQIETAHGVCCVAEGCKIKSSWWPFQGSTAGIVCGSAAGLLLGPVGVSVGAAVGGAIGLTFGKILKASCETRMNEILEECNGKSRPKHKSESIIKDRNNEYELLVEVFDDNLNNNSDLLLSDNHYNAYISKATLNDILENVDIIP